VFRNRPKKEYGYEIASKAQLAKSEKEFAKLKHRLKELLMGDFAEIDEVLYRLEGICRKMGWIEEANKLDRLKLEAHGVSIIIGGK